MSARLGILADEVLLQKRMTIIQSILLLLCLGFVIFSRSSIGNYMEFPVVPNMRSKSPLRMRLPMESPSTSPSHTRPNSSREEDHLFGSDNASPERHPSNSHHTDTPPRLTIEVSPPRSSSSPDLSDSEGRTDLSNSPEQLDIRRRRQSPSQENSNSPGTSTKPSRDDATLYSWRVNGDSELLRPGDPFVGPSRGGGRYSAGQHQRQSQEPLSTVTEHIGVNTDQGTTIDGNDDMSDESPLDAS